MTLERILAGETSASVISSVIELEKSANAGKRTKTLANVRRR